jgi:hypothetical protein
MSFPRGDLSGFWTLIQENARLWPPRYTGRDSARVNGVSTPFVWPYSRCLIKYTLSIRAMCWLPCHSRTCWR